MKAALAEPKSKSNKPGKPGAPKPVQGSDVSALAFCALLGGTLLASAIMYASIGLYWSKFSRAEVFFAECAREMIVTNNYVTPLYHNQPFFDKPILIYWLIIAMFKNFGLNHWAARLPSICAGVLAVGATAFGGAALFGRRVGLIAASMLATSFLYLSFAASCMSDMLLVLLDTITLSCIYAGLESNPRRTFLWFLASASMAVAFLTKGPVGVVLPGITALLYMTFTKQLQKITFVHVVIGLFTLCAIASPWFIAAYKANGWSAIVYFFVHENLQRFAGDTYDAHQPFYYTVVSLFTGFAPWSIFLPVAALDFARAWRRGEIGATIDKKLYLWTWIAVLIGFFSCSKGKCDYYALPTFPAAAMLTAMSFEDHIRKGGKIVTAAFGILLAALAIAGIGCGYIANKIDASVTDWTWVVSPILIIGFSGLALFALFKQRPFTAYGLAVISLFAGLTSFVITVLPAMAHLIPVEKYAAYINTTNPDATLYLEQPLYSWRDELAFRTNRHAVVTDGSANFQAIINRGGQYVFIMNESTYQTLSSASRAKLTVSSRDYALTKPLTPGLVIHTGGHRQGDQPILLLTHLGNRP